MRAGRADCLGFSLIEIVVVLALLAILAAFAMPSYQASVRKARRVEGKAFLHTLMMVQERHFASFNRYTADTGPKGLNLPKSSQPGGYYILFGLDLSADAQWLKITVSPQGAQASDPCGDLSLDSTGLYAASGSAAEECR